MKTRKGGQKVNVFSLQTFKTIYEPFCKHKKDCVASCFYVLGYTNLKNSRYLAQRTTTGLYKVQIRDMLDAAYGKGHIWLNTHNLNKKEATIASLNYKYNGHLIGHSFILYRTEDDEMYVIDPQLDIISPFHEYKQMFKPIEILFLNSHETEKLDSDRVTEDIINSVLDPPLPDMPDLPGIEASIDEALEALEVDSKP
jgi:hypothetical protein